MEVLNETYKYEEVWSSAHEVGFSLDIINHTLNFGTGHWQTGYNQKDLEEALKEIGEKESKKFALSLKNKVDYEWEQIASTPSPFFLR